MNWRVALSGVLLGLVTNGDWVMRVVQLAIGIAVIALVETELRRRR